MGAHVLRHHSAPHVRFAGKDGLATWLMAGFAAVAATAIFWIYAFS